MSNRISSNGAYTHSIIPRSSAQPELTSLGSGRGEEEIPAQPIVEKVGAAIKKSPAVTLLVALAAGLAIGMWAKRS